MTYLIQGTLTKQDKPEKYLNKYVDFRLKEGLTETSWKYFYTESKVLANWLNKRGMNLKWNEDYDAAERMCRQRTINIEQTKFTAPKSSWEEFLMKKFGETKDEKNLEGELFLWDEKRAPLSWLYFEAEGRLKDNFVFENEKFVQGPRKVGERLVTGFSLDTHFLNLYARRSEVRISL